MKLLLSSNSLEGITDSLNKYFYSTTYRILNGSVTWKNGEVKNDLILKVTKGRFKIYSTNN